MHGLPLEYLLPSLFIITVVHINDVFHIFWGQVPLLPLPALHVYKCVCVCACTCPPMKLQCFSGLSVAYLSDHGIEEHLL